VFAVARRKTRTYQTSKRSVALRRRGEGREKVVTNGVLLTDTMGAVHRLKVILRVPARRRREKGSGRDIEGERGGKNGPVRVEEDHGVGSNKVDTDTSSTGGEDEEVDACKKVRKSQRWGKGGKGGRKRTVRGTRSFVEVLDGWEKE
jgi:hypothetical protein